VSIDTPALWTTGLRRFQDLTPAAIDAVTKRLYAGDGAAYAPSGQAGRVACREELGFQLEFLRSVLEFGLVQPMVDYLRWLTSLLASRELPTAHLALSLDWLGEFFAAEMRGPDSEIVVEALRQVKARYLQSHDAAPTIHGSMPDAWPEAAAFETALLAGDRRAAVALLEHCLQQGHGLVQSELHMIQPAMYGIGRQWQNNQVTVAQEHLATAIAQSVMTLGLFKSAIPPPNGHKVLLACVAGNMHSIGLQMVADAFQLSGWEVQFLDANVPADALISQVEVFKPNLLGLSVSFALQLSVVKQIMSRLTQSFGSARPAVIVGGLAVNQFDRLAPELGVDGWSPDASAAVVSAAKIALPAGSR
jgi:methanogenic corrinoid protein MtbC1